MSGQPYENSRVEVSKADIVSGLGALGLSAGMKVMVHSSLASFGRVAGGAGAVIEALTETVTEAGTVMMPSFNHGTPFEASGPGYYDPQLTPTTNGAIADTFWRMSGVRRSLNPTHPFAAWGEDADRYLRDHHNTLTMGRDSPLGMMLADDGLALLIGVDYRVNTFHHVVETMTAAPCLGRRSERYAVKLPGGEVVEGRSWGWRREACPLTSDGGYGEELARDGLERRVRIGASTLRLFRLADCFETVAALLASGRGQAPPCRLCPIRPRRVAATVASDWDEASGRPAMQPDADGY